MSILIGNYEFEGPFREITELLEKPGLLAVLHCDDEEYSLIQLSQAEDLRSQIELSPSFSDQDDGYIILAACYTEHCGLRQRQEMVDEILIEFGDEDEPTYVHEHLVQSAS